MAITLSSIIEWLRAGYPEGIPPTDRFPVYALLKRRLTDDEVKYVAAQLVADGAADGGGITVEEIEGIAASVLHEPPSDADINRVAARLAAAGWPLADTVTQA